ncbi:hypothetical protein E6O75_ATG02938 [Venturia nashicola]|uniref:Uncharacterized protein n=1 Tax=Venturia nashicola TaxID=86259 RepID=A0A4Z1PLC2_9PEZI|nr:hypothetical protein E6O75_ATG02938 [Venturia nashicola]
MTKQLENAKSQMPLGKSRETQKVSVLLVGVYAKRGLWAIGRPRPRSETKQASARMTQISSPATRSDLIELLFKHRDLDVMERVMSGHLLNDCRRLSSRFQRFPCTRVSKETEAFCRLSYQASVSILHLVLYQLQDAQYPSAHIQGSLLCPSLVINRSSVE